MTAFQCVPIETETAERFRRTGLDDNGNVLRRIVANAAGGFPCRHCLRSAAPGQAVLLGSYNLPRPRGIYWTPSPIFVHADACTRFDAANEVAAHRSLEHPGVGARLRCRGPVHLRPRAGLSG